MRGGRIERDGVTGAQLVLLEADLDAQRPAHDVAVLPAVVAHQRLVWRGRAAHLVDGLEEVDPVLLVGDELLPSDAGVQVDRRPFPRVHYRGAFGPAVPVRA